ESEPPVDLLRLELENQRKKFLHENVGGIFSFGSQVPAGANPLGALTRLFHIKRPWAACSQQTMKAVSKQQVSIWKLVTEY
ncbi:MAG: hypothetical protein R6V54_02265, partial [Desulfobacteraceae bacterium]